MGFRPFQVANYRFVELLDRGGSADVFRVESTDDKGFLRSFAVKRVTTYSQFDDKAAERLKREAKVHRLLTHPHIARLYDAFRSKQSLFLVVEYVEGLNLRTVAQRLADKDKTLPIDLSVHLILKVATAMAYAHKVTDPDSGRPLRIIHRDLTPRNLMLGKDGEVKVIDFGIASADNVTKSTAAGCVRGTLAYMSPEQAGAQGVDQRSDIYSVGLILLELLTGGRVFDSESEVELLQKIVGGQLPSAASLNPDVQAELDRIVTMATARIPGDRYQSMDSFRKDLEKCMTLDSSKATQRLAELIKKLSNETTRAPGSSDWEQPVLSPQEERAMKDGFRKLEGALGIELETYEKTHIPEQANYRERVDWTKNPQRHWEKSNRPSIVMAVIVSLAFGILLARFSKEPTPAQTNNKPAQTSRAAVAP